MTESTQLQTGTTDDRSPEEAFVNMLGRHKPLLAKVARGYCSDPEDRKDLLQEIALQLWRSYPNYKEEFAETTWMYRIALNVSISFLRKSTSRRKAHAEYGSLLDFTGQHNPETDDRLSELYAFMETLNSLDKGLLILLLDGSRNKDIAEIMGISVSSVSTRLYRIKEKFTIHFQNKKNNLHEF